MSPTPSFQSHQRRQALHQNHREAAGQLDGDRCGGRINASPAPPHPPITGVPPKIGRTGQAGGGLIAFFNLATRGEPLKPVDCVGCHLANRDSTKRAARFAITEPPQIGLFYPHFWCFLPHPSFLAWLAFSLSISLFLEREERKEGRKNQKSSSTVLILGSDMYPHFFLCIHGFSWMPNRAAAQCWRGFAWIFRPIHTSTRGNALGGVRPAVWGVRHGV